MKEFWGRRCIAALILNFHTRRRLVVSFTPRQLYLLRKSPQDLLDRRLCGP